MTTFVIKWVDLANLSAPARTERVRGYGGSHVVALFLSGRPMAEIVHIIAA